jgi:hypothetical protein
VSPKTPRRRAKIVIWLRDGYEAAQRQTANFSRDGVGVDRVGLRSDLMRAAARMPQVHSLIPGSTIRPASRRLESGNQGVGLDAVQLSHSANMRC